LVLIYLILVAIASPIIYIILLIHWVTYFEKGAVSARNKRARIRKYSAARRKREAMWKNRLEAVWNKK